MNDNLNIRFIEKLINNEVAEYYDSYELAKEQRAYANNLNELIEILKSNDYDLIGQNIGLFFIAARDVLNYSISLSKNFSKEIFESAKTCKMWKSGKENNYEKYNAARILLRRRLKKLKEEYQTRLSNYYSLRPKKTGVMINQYVEINENFRKRVLIDSYQYYLLSRLFDEKGIGAKEKIILLEKVKQHNSYCHVTERNEAFDFQKSHEIIDMIQNGYEEIIVPDIDSPRKNEINTSCEVLFSQRLKLPTKFIYNYLPTYQGNLVFSYEYSKEEFDYYIFTLLEKLQDDMYLCSTEIMNQEFYRDIAARNSLRDEYYADLNLYKLVRDFYDEQIKLYEKKEEVTEIPDVYKFRFAARGSLNEKTYFEADLKKVPKDLYGLIQKLLIHFKKGIIPGNYLKQLTELGHGVAEIKDDQLRIVYSHVKDNEYAILGVFVKKVDNDRQTYVNISKRSSAGLIGDEKYEEELFNSLESKKHNGGRINS